jgi:cob(I)alamin adenosyltransferase
MRNRFFVTAEIRTGSGPILYGHFGASASMRGARTIARRAARTLNAKTEAHVTAQIRDVEDGCSVVEVYTAGSV